MMSAAINIRHSLKTAASTYGLQICVEPRHIDFINNAEYLRRAEEVALGDIGGIRK